VISTASDGSMSIGANKEYLKRVNKLKRMRSGIVKKDMNYLPFDRPVVVECIFYINVKDSRKYSLTDLVASTLDTLVQMRILKTDGHTVVARTDGSRILHTEETQRTQINIRRLQGG
jgi:hypothetical protein